MRRRLLHCLIGSTALAGCRDKSASESAPPPPKLAGAHDAGVAAPKKTAPDALSPAPGTWAYTRPESKCVLQILTSPPTERAKVHDAAVARLAALGGTSTVEMTYFGDRVARVDVVGAKRPKRPPRTNGEAQLIAVGAIAPYADLFAVPIGELMTVGFSTEHIDDATGFAWETFGMLTRKSTTPGISQVGTDEVLVDLDRHGAPVALRVGNGIMPPVTTCSDTLTDDEVRRAVIGTRLTYNADGQANDYGAVESADIARIEREVTVIRGSAYDGDVLVGAVYRVTVHKNDTPWWLFVDPSTSEVIETRQAYDD